MGNQDFVVIINGETAILVLSSEYYGDGYIKSIEIAANKYKQYIEGAKSVSDNPEDVDDIIRKIETFPILK